VITVEEALARILSHVHPLGSEEKPLLECLDRVLAEDVRSDVDVPPADNSAMDGYAVRAQDIQAAITNHPVSLRVIEEVSAGKESQIELTPGDAIRIMTGAPLPRGADTVVPFEDTDEEDRRDDGLDLTEIAIRKRTPKGSNIRLAGEDISKGESIVRRGVALTPALLGVLASIGRSSVKVGHRPKVALLATGDELVSPGTPLAPGKIFDSNTYSLAAQVLRCGGVPDVLGVARDDVEDLRRHLRKATDADLVITSAGVSRGYYDVVKEVLAEEGRSVFGRSV
jgi:molybdopterin molybdotransferase